MHTVFTGSVGVRVKVPQHAGNLAAEQAAAGAQINLCGVDSGCKTASVVRVFRWSHNISTGRLGFETPSSTPFYFQTHAL